MNYIRLPLQNAYNVRDLGGYACDGGVTDWRAFVRADSLHRLSGDDVDFLLDYGIRTVIDLRSANELEDAPDPDGLKAFTDYHHIPLMSGNVTEVTTLPDGDPASFLGRFYLSTLKDETLAVRSVMEAIAEAREGGVLFHCAGGKDRTGITAALLLGLVGVARADILANYEVTYTYNSQNMEMSASASKYPVEYMYSRRESMEPALDYIAGFGSTEAYLRTVGVDERALGKIKARLVG